MRLIDCLLTRIYDIRSYSDDPQCLLRVSRSPAASTAVLLDGTVIRPGDLVLEVHFWNEHLAFQDTGLAWGVAFLRRLKLSLDGLGQWASCQPGWSSFVAVHGLLGFMRAEEVARLKEPARRLGFDLVLRAASGLRFWRGAFWVQLWAWWLMWAYNPESRRGKRLRDMALVDLWMSRGRLLAGELVESCSEK